MYIHRIYIYVYIYIMIFFCVPRSSVLIFLGSNLEKKNGGAQIQYKQMCAHNLNRQCCVVACLLVNRIVVFAHTFSTGNAVL